MSTFWDDRFASVEYVYGTEPNEYFKTQLDRLCPGYLLLPGEGEGRNAVYAARQGWKVHAFDSSVKGQKKALNLACSHNVDIEYQLISYQEFSPPKDKYYDCIALLYTHMPVSMRSSVHKKLVSYLKPGGHLILEGFSKSQLGKGSGGPKDLSMLFSEEELRQDFLKLKMLHVEQLNTTLNEGTYHRGLASIIRLFGIK